MSRQQPEIPPHLTVGEIERHARAADSLFDFSRRCRVSRRHARELLRRYNLQDEIPSTVDNAINNPGIDDDPFPW